MKKLFLMGLLFATTNLCAQSAALTLSVTNKVTATVKKVERNLSRGAPLTTGEAVRTNKNALASLKYSNGTFVDLGELSDYIILSYSPKQSDVTIKAEIKSGKLHSKTSGKLKETLKTPVIALSILGTDYNVYVADQNTVYVKVNSGRVQAGNKVFTSGQSFVVTRANGVSAAPFPREGYVTAGYISGPGSQGGVALAQNARQCTAADGSDCLDATCQFDNLNSNLTNTSIVDSSLFLGATTSGFSGLLALIP